MRIEIFRQPQLAGAAADVGHAGFSRFLHDVAKLSRQQQAALAFDGDGFRFQYFAADLRPGQPCDDADFVGLVDLRRQIFNRAENRLEIFHRYGKRRFFFQQNRLAYLAAYGADGLFQSADARFARIPLDNRLQDGLGEAGLAGLEAVFLELLRHEVLFGDLYLFFFRIARKFDNFHAVQERPGNIADDVGRRNPEDLGQIEGNIEVMVGEGIVLFRVQYFEKGRRRVAAHVRRHLVDFVKKEYGVLDAGLLEARNDAARHRADVSAAVASDFRFIPHAA